MSKTANSRFKTCFVSAPFDVNTASLRAALDENGIQWFDSASAAPVGYSMLDTVDAAIAQADFVCSVIPKDPGGSAVLIEIGLAVAHGRPLLVLVEPSASLPAYLQSVPYARIGLEDKEALGLHLSAFLQHADSSSSRRLVPERIAQQPVDTEWAILALDALEQTPERNQAIQLERVVARLLEQAGAVVSSKPANAERGVDMAISISALEPSLGNPLLVEVKAGKLDRYRVEEAERKLRIYVEKTAARAGLLVLRDGLPNERAPKGWPLIISMSARELAGHVGQGSLIQALITARNQAVHGRA